MATIREVRLKRLFATRQVIDAIKQVIDMNEQVIDTKIQKLTNKLVLSEVFFFPEKPSYPEVLEVLKNFLEQNRCRWVNLTFAVPYFKIRIFVFGKKKFILDNVKEITGRILAGDRWMGEEAGISSSEEEFSLEDFL